MDFLVPDAPFNACALSTLHATRAHANTSARRMETPRPGALSTNALPSLRMFHVEEEPCAAGRALLCSGSGAFRNARERVRRGDCALGASAYAWGCAEAPLKTSFESIAVAFLVRAV